MSAVHRNGDSRSCGASTIVSGQSTVFANGKLVSVNADPNSHGAGALIASCNQVFIGGKMVVKEGNSASADSLCASQAGAHCAPNATSGSQNVFVG